jgi:taurine-pyruvate aminotransferase
MVRIRFPPAESLRTCLPRSSRHRSVGVGSIRSQEEAVSRLELVKDRSSKEQLDPAQIGGVVDFCRDGGVIVGRAGGGRRFGTTIALCPPLVITRAECDRIVETLGRALQTLAID